MRKLIVTIIIFFGMGFIACTTQSKSIDQKANVKAEVKTENPMNNVISIIEVPVTDLQRATEFYQALLQVKIEQVEMGDTQMGIIPNEVGTVNAVLVKGNDYVPTTEGAVIYWNAGKDLQIMLERIEKNGGKVLVPKTEISPEMGFFALFIDTEGNKLGLHSIN
jgi:uncharacterized protein